MNLHTDDADTQRNIDPSVEKLAYPETKFEYFTDKVLGGMCIAVGYLVVTKVLPSLFQKMFKKPNGPTTLN